MKLHEGIKGESYLVREVMVADRLTRRLEALGVNEKTKITIMNKKKERNPDCEGERHPAGSRARHCRGN